MNVLERLQALMNARGWTMYRLAKESGLTESTIANICRRNAIPSIDTLERIPRPQQSRQILRRLRSIGGTADGL